MRHFRRKRRLTLKMGCGGSKPEEEGAAKSDGKAYRYKKAMADAQANMKAAMEKAKKGAAAAQAKSAEIAATAKEKYSAVVKPKVAAAADKGYEWAKKAAAASKEFAIDLKDSSKATAQMALLETKYRAAKSRVASEKEKFGAIMLTALKETTDDGTGSSENGKLVGDLKEGSEALTIFTEFSAKIAQLEADMKEARDEIAQLKAKVKAAWGTKSQEMKAIEAVEQAKSQDLPMGEELVAAADEDTEVVEAAPEAAAPATEIKA